MDYIETLRSKVGHMKVIMASTSVCIYNEKREVLLQLRSDTGTWGLPGGYMELGESIKETAIREVFEEMNVCLEEEFLKLRGVFSSFETTYANGDEVQTVCILFEYPYQKITEKLGKSGNENVFQVSTEVLDTQFFSYENVPTIFNEENKAMVFSFFQDTSIEVR